MGSEGSAGGGIGEPAAATATKEPLSGTGGSAGGGTVSGDAEPAGINTDRSDPAEAPLECTGEAAGRTGDTVAAEAAALGSADGSLADAARAGGPAGRRMGDALDGGAGRDIGEGTPGDKGELGGGAALGQHGGTGPAGTGSPGGDTRD